MIEFIFTILLMFSLSFLLYLMVRALPRMAEEPTVGDNKNLLDRWAHSDIPEKIDATFNGFLLKFLSRTKIMVLKMDNTLGKQLRRMRTEKTDQKQVRDFNDIKKSEEDEIK